MAKLYRPPIPLEVKCRVALRQLGEMFIDNVIATWKMKPGDPYLLGIGVRIPRLGLGRLLALKLDQLAELLNCPVQQLRLDHDQALENRTKRPGRMWVKGKGYRDIIIYDPPANDPDFMRYRPHAAEFDGSHHIKTNVRGDHGQFADNVLAKRERHRLKKVASQKAPINRTRKGSPFRPAAGGRKIANRGGWPPKGSRPFNRRKKR